MRNYPKYLMAGASGAGKTSLIMALKGLEGKAPKTQALVFHSRFIDLPGEYLTHPYLRKQFLSGAGQADAIFFLLAANELPSPLPPGLMTQPGLPVHGILSKCDLPNADPDHGEREMARLSIKPPYYRISIKDNGSLKPLLRLIDLEPDQSGEREHETRNCNG